VQEVIRAAGPIADEFEQPFGGEAGQNARHLFTLYASGLQLSLVVQPASWRAGLPPLSVALYDVDGQLARPWTPAAALVTVQTAREWASLAWLALGDLVKYLDRGSAWEARSQLEEPDLEAVGAGNRRDLPRVRADLGAGYSGAGRSAWNGVHRSRPGPGGTGDSRSCPGWRA